MRSVTARVPAKVNLALSVGPARDDGFHQLATVYHAVDLHDDVVASWRDDGEITVRVVDRDSGDGPATVPLDKTNLAVRAAMALRRKLHDPALGVDLTIVKSIPVAGGMAGGSADAAAALVACNELWDGGLSRAALEPLAAKIGSDVPFLLHGGSALGTGRGEKVSQVLSRGSYDWVFVTSEVGLSTAEVYAQFDKLASAAAEEPEVPDAILAALRAGDPELLGASLVNDLQAPALSLRPELSDLLEHGMDAGALGAIVSGSGPTVALLAQNDAHRMELEMDIASRFNGVGVFGACGPAPGARLL